MSAADATAKLTKLEDLSHDDIVPLDVSAKRKAIVKELTLGEARDIMTLAENVMKANVAQNDRMIKVRKLLRDSLLSDKF